MYSHASNPTPVHLEGDVFRIFFSSRSEDKRSHIGFIDYNIMAQKLERVSETPVLVPGNPGYFDDAGISSACIALDDQGKYRFFYVGWNLGVTVPFRNSIGLALGQTLDGFEKPSCGPILDRTFHDPLSLSYPWVLRDRDGWRMWYGSHVSWQTERSEMLHVLAHAVSTDGWTWTPTGHISLPRTDTEYAFSRPCVIKEQGRYKMWFSVRGNSYSIDYAESADGFSWERGDSIIAGSGTGWDAESASYAAVFDHRNTRYMLYCGNNYGATGFGLGVLT